MKGSATRARVRARRSAVQALYQWQLTGQAPAEIVDEFVAERDLVDVDLAHFRRLICDIPGRLAELEGLLRSYVDRDLAQLDPVERAVLLIGAYELCHCPDIPWRVVLNEAVELSKMFGAEQAHKLVNAALDRLARAVRAGESTARA